MAGVDLTTVSRLMGHYPHLQPEPLRCRETASPWSMGA